MTTKIERQLTLMEVLISTNRHLDLDEIRARVPGYAPDPESFRRTFERDKVDLRAMGVPLDIQKTPGSDPPIDGYRIFASEYALRDPGLYPEELEALLLAGALVGGEDLQGALLKIGAGLQAEVPTVEVPTDAELLKLFGAVAERRVVSFTYKDLRRDVHPYLLQFMRGRWYLNGLDLVRGESRWYRVERIDGTVEVNDPPGVFDRPTVRVNPLRMDPWVLGESIDPMVVRVWFDAEIAGAVRAEMGQATVVSDDDDGLVVDLTVTNPSGLRSWVLSFLDRAEVLSPPEMRQSVIDWLEEAARG